MRVTETARLRKTISYLMTENRELRRALAMRTAAYATSANPVLPDGGTPKDGRAMRQYEELLEKIHG